MILCVAEFENVVSFVFAWWRHVMTLCDVMMSQNSLLLYRLVNVLKWWHTFISVDISVAGFQAIQSSKLIQSSPNKNCTLDPFPTWMIKQYASELVPFITVYCNTSLRDGSFPVSQKNAIVTPVLDAHAAANYRPISNLSYLSKLLERCVNKQLNEYLSTNDLLPSVPSVYSRRFHSTESAVLKVLSDIYATADEKMMMLLGLLDLSAAFDIVDHQILFDRLRYEYGLDGSVLRWFKSYLTNRTICVHYNGQTSETVSIMPQGSVLGPILFILYVAGAINIASKHGFAAHSYAARPPDLRPLTSIFLFESGGVNVGLCRRDWRMDGQQSTQTQPFKDGADLAWILSAAGALPGWWTQRRWGTHQADYARPWPRRHDWPRSVVASSHQPCYTNLLLPSASTASHPAFSRDRHGTLLVRALLHSRLDYCNWVLAGMFQYQIDRLQSVLRAAARLVLGLPKWASVSDAMQDKLHWLPFPERVDFKLCSVVYR